MKVFRLFAKRLLAAANVHWRAWRSSLDWSVWLYILVPAVVIGGGMYRDLWISELIVSPTTISSLFIMQLVMVIIIATGRLRIYVEAADRLFLMQQKRWLTQIKGWSYCYSYLMFAIRLMLPFLIALPYLVRVELLGSKDILLLWLVNWLLQIIVAMIEHVISATCYRFKKYGSLTILWIGQAIVVVMLPMYMISSSELLRYSVLLVLSAVVILSTIVGWRMSIRMEHEVKRNEAAQLFSTKLLISQSITVKKVSTLQRPLVWRLSNRLFQSVHPAVILAEMRIKSFVRELNYLQSYIGFISVSTVALWLVPKVAAIIIMPLLLIIAWSWLNWQRKIWLQDFFIGQFKWSTAVQLYANSIARFWILLPVIVWWALFVGIKVGGLLIALGIAGIVGVLWYMLHRMEWRTYASENDTN